VTFVGVRSHGGKFPNSDSYLINESVPNIHTRIELKEKDKI
jgi:hypothetical protein